MKIQNIILLSTQLFVGFTQSQLTISDFKLSVTDATGDVKLSKKLEYPKSLASALELGKQDVIRINFGVSKGADKLATDVPFPIIALETSESKTHSYHTVPSSKLGQYKLNLAFKNIPKLIKEANEPVNVYLLLSGVVGSQPIKYAIGKLALPEATVTARAPAAFGPQPLIHHTFRVDEKVPHVILSYVFSSLVLAPWALLIAAWQYLGVNAKRFPSQPTRAVPHAVFLVTLVAYAVLNYQYWTHLNLFETLYYFGAITVVSVPSGYVALKSHKLS